jgi:hypothetical protein
MPSNPVKYQYKPTSPFQFFLRRAKYELDNIDRFLNLAKNAQRSQQNVLERVAAKRHENIPDDWLVDDFAELDDFAALSAEFAIVGLWRCIELYRKRAIHVASGEKAAKNAYKHKEFQRELLRLGITEKRIRCARSVDELRCLNNSVKHDKHVNDELTEFPRWRSKKGRKLGNLEPHYPRLRSAAERYLTDLAERLSSMTCHARFLETRVRTH